MLFGGFSPSGCKARGGSFPPGPLEEVLKKDQGKWHGTEGGRIKGLKRILTKPERRLSPSALGKGELKGTRRRLAKRILLLQSCQSCIHYICIENQGRKLCIFSASQNKDRGLLVALWVLFKDKIFNGNVKVWEALCVCA